MRFWRYLVPGGRRLLSVLLVLSEELAFAASVLEGQGNLGPLQTRLVQSGGSMLASFLRDDPYG